jgi:3-phenylpropionate/cinnamic acid dioxygenase small subunit
MGRQKWEVYYRQATNINTVYRVGQYRKVYYRQATKINWRKMVLSTNEAGKTGCPHIRRVKLDLYPAHLTKT